MKVQSPLPIPLEIKCHAIVCRTKVFYTMLSNLMEKIAKFGLSLCHEILFLEKIDASSFPRHYSCRDLDEV